MQDKELIDSEISESLPKDSILTMVKWWERKRILFNVLLIALIGFLLFIFSAEIKFYGFSNAISHSISYLIAANCAYCLGWGGEILLKVYFNFNCTPFLRSAGLILGISFSMLLTFSVYALVLSDVLML